MRLWLRCSVSTRMQEMRDRVFAICYVISIVDVRLNYNDRSDGRGLRPRPFFALIDSYGGKFLKIEEIYRFNLRITGGCDIM